MTASLTLPPRICWNSSLDTKSKRFQFRAISLIYHFFTINAHLLAQIIWRSTLKYKHMQDSELFSDARIGRHLFGGIRSWSMLEEGGSIYHLVLADLNGCGQQLRSRTFLFGLFGVQAIIQFDGFQWP